MSGSEETTEAKVTSHHSNPSRIRTSAARTDTGDSHNSPMRRSTPSAEIRYRPPQEETRKFHLAALLWLSIISLLLVPMATLLDVPIARWCHADHLPQEFSKMLDLSLIYAHGSGIFLIPCRHYDDGSDKTLENAATCNLGPGERSGRNVSQDVRAKATPQFTKTRLGDQRTCMDMVLRLDPVPGLPSTMLARELSPAVTSQLPQR